MSRRVCVLVSLLVLPAWGAACAKDATEVTVTVDVDATVPPILILRTAVARADEPDRRVSSDRVSSAAGDADRPGPYEFPLDLPVTVDASFAGPVVITVEGVDWDTSAVTAAGRGDAVVTAGKTTATALTLTAVVDGVADGGAR